MKFSTKIEVEYSQNAKVSFFFPCKNSTIFRVNKNSDSFFLNRHFFCYHFSQFCKMFSFIPFVITQNRDKNLKFRVGRRWLTSWIIEIIPIGRFLAVYSLTCDCQYHNGNCNSTNPHVSGTSIFLFTKIHKSIFCRPLWSLSTVFRHFTANSTWLYFIFCGTSEIFFPSSKNTPNFFFLWTEKMASLLCTRKFFFVSFI